MLHSCIGDIAAVPCSKCRTCHMITLHPAESLQSSQAAMQLIIRDILYIAGRNNAGRQLHIPATNLGMFCSHPSLHCHARPCSCNVASADVVYTVTYLHVEHQPYAEGEQLACLNPELQVGMPTPRKDLENVYIANLPCFG